MKFNIIINATDNWPESCQHALTMCQTIIDEGHEIGLVFFYGQSVNIINKEFEVIEWQQWQQKHQIKLCLCSAMLEREGIENQAKLNAHFHIVGLASWVNAFDQADKSIEFS